MHKRILQLTPAVLGMMATPAFAAASNKGVIGKTVWETLDRGGEVMYIILLLSVVGLALILEAAFRTRRTVILPKKTAKQLEGPDAHTEVGVLLESKKQACVHKILATGHLWRKGTQDQIQSAIEETVDEMLWRFKRSVRPIGIIANTAPLLGLLGTVLGIVEAFDVVAKQGALGDPSALAGGISKALLTTCFGLIVAIPMLLSYHYFTGKVETLLRRSEELVKEALIRPPQ